MEDSMPLELNSSSNSPYHPISASNQEIRLVKLLPLTEDNNQQIRCTLENASLQDNPLFTAVSYAWGDHSQTASIELDDSEFQVSKNLFVLLQHIRTSSPLTLWIDALCIDQKNDEEKSWQVAQMGETYKKATETIVWLGPAEDDSDLAMDKFLAIGEEALRCGILELSHTKFDATKWVAVSLFKQQIDDEGPLERLFRTSTIGSTRSATLPVFAILPLLKRQWGTRVWVMQELILSQNPVFVCGHKRVPMGHFDGALFLFENMYNIILSAYSKPSSALLLSKIIAANSLSGQSSPWFDGSVAELLRVDLQGPDDGQPVATMLRVRRRYLRNQALGNKTDTLLTLLLHSNQLEATDLRDRVYGVLGLVSSADTFGIQPDYTKTWQSLYVQAAKCIFNTSLGVNALLFRNPETHLPGLPSWALDFAPNPISFSSDVPHFRAGNGKIESRLEFRQVGGREVLYVLGTSFDKVSILGAPLYDVEQISSMEPGEQWKSISRWIKTVQRTLYPNATAYLAGQSREEAICRTLIRDQEINEEAMIRAPNSGLEFYRILQLPFSEGIIHQDMLSPPVHVKTQVFIEAVESAVSGRRVFVTSTGYMGLGPKDIQDGDRIVVLAGAYAPYILRRDEGGFYRYVGDAYIHGIMDGEALTEDTEFEMLAMC